jgi:two-component system response regulator NreC
MDAPTVRVVLADDHAIMRAGLRRLLEGEAGCEVVAEAGTVEDTVRFVGAHKPDVVVLDLNMPDGSSLPAIPRLLEASPDTRVVVLTMQIEPAFAREALQAGATGYVLKEAADEELIAAVEAAVAGQSYLNPQLAARVAMAPPTPSGPPDGLSEREAEVLTLIALGHTNAEIAEQLYLSIRTVETHRSHIQQKLRLAKRSELVRYALDKGLIEPEN